MKVANVHFGIIEGGEIIIPAIDTWMDPMKCLTLGPYEREGGLRGWENFQKRVLPVLTPIDSAPAVKCVAFLVTKKMTTEELKRCFPEQYLAQWHHILYLIGLQTRKEVLKTGEVTYRTARGLLRTDGRGNLFRMLGVDNREFFITVHWQPWGKEWSAEAWTAEELIYVKEDYPLFMMQSNI